jgi:hypothetical protein
LSAASKKPFHSGLERNKFSKKSLSGQISIESQRKSHVASRRPGCSGPI